MPIDNGKKTYSHGIAKLRVFLQQEISLHNPCLQLYEIHVRILPVIF